MKEKIDFVIVVRDRDNERIQRCIDSLLDLPIGNIFIVDYGSKEKVKVKNAEVIYYNKNKIWNKSHGLNLGIKRCKSEYICTIDCDIILTDELKKRLLSSLSDYSFIYNTNVLRININDIKEDFNKTIKKAKPWHSNNRGTVYSKANGGIQCFPRRWIDFIGGYDEELGVYFGAMDNRVYEQATMCGLTTINLNFPMFHQEHKDKKEDNLPKEEREKAELIRIFKAKYLVELMNKGRYKNDNPWGEKIPHQEKFLKMADEYLEMQNKTDPEKINFIKEIYTILKNSKSKKADILIDDEKFLVTIG